VNRAEMVTDFKIGHDWYETPMGTFPDYQTAADACTKNDLSLTSVSRAGARWFPSRS
jgi:hypothetical protein